MVPRRLSWISENSNRRGSMTDPSTDRQSVLNSESSAVIFDVAFGRTAEELSRIGRVNHLAVFVRISCCLQAVPCC